LPQKRKRLTAPATVPFSGPPRCSPPTSPHPAPASRCPTARR